MHAREKKNLSTYSFKQIGFIKTKFMVLT